MLSEELLLVKERRSYIALSSKPNSCHLHEFSCGCLQMIIATGRGDCWHSFIERHVGGSWSPHLCIQPYLPTSCMQFGPTCSWPSNLREGRGCVRWGRLEEGGAIYGNPSSMLGVDLLCGCPSVTHQQPLTDALEVSPVISLVRLVEQNFALSLDF